MRAGQAQAEINGFGSALAGLVDYDSDEDVHGAHAPAGAQPHKAANGSHPPVPPAGKLLLLLLQSHGGCPCKRVESAGTCMRTTQGSTAASLPAVCDAASAEHTTNVHSGCRSAHAHTSWSLLLSLMHASSTSLTCHRPLQCLIARYVHPTLQWTDSHDFRHPLCARADAPGGSAAAEQLPGKAAGEAEAQLQRRRVLALVDAQEALREMGAMQCSLQLLGKLSPTLRSLQHHQARLAHLLCGILLPTKFFLFARQNSALLGR